MAIGLDQDVIDAINKNVTPSFGQWSMKNYGIGGKKLLAKLTAGESGGTHKRAGVSSAGARGAGQFISSTRDAFRKQYNIDPWKNADEAIKGSIIHLTKYGGLKGYNPGMSTYTDYILGQKVDKNSLNALKTGKHGATTAGARGKTIGGGTRKELVSARAPSLKRGGVKFDSRSFLVDYLSSDSKKRGSLGKALVSAKGSGAYDLVTPDIFDKGEVKFKNVKDPSYKIKGGKAAAGSLGQVQKDGWKGSKSVGDALARSLGLPISSEKRATVNTASGNVSDHYQGNKDSYAWDIGVTGPAGTKKVQQLAKKLGRPDYKGGYWLNVNRKINGRTYRFQVGWNVPDHYDHIHMGVDRIDTPG